MRTLTSLLLAGALLFGAAACGDDDEGGGGDDRSSEEQEYVDAAVSTFDPEEDAPLTEEDARCIATSMVDNLGVERLEELGITPESFGDEESALPEDLDEDEANRVVDGFEGCFDMTQLFLEGIDEDGALSPEARECLADAFDEDVTRRIFVTMLTEGEDALEEDQELMSEFLRLYSACPEALPQG